MILVMFCEGHIFQLPGMRGDFRVVARAAKFQHRKVMFSTTGDYDFPVLSVEIAETTHRGSPHIPCLR